MNLPFAPFAFFYASCAMRLTAAATLLNPASAQSPPRERVDKVPSIVICETSVSCIKKNSRLRDPPLRALCSDSVAPVSSYPAHGSWPVRNNRVELTQGIFQNRQEAKSLPCNMFMERRHKQYGSDRRILPWKWRLLPFHNPRYLT